MRTALVLALLTLLAACAPSGRPGGFPGGLAGTPRSCGIRPYAEVPLTLSQNTPLVQARINGNPVTLLLDTGAERVLLTQEAVHRLGLVVDPARTFTEQGAGGAFSSAAAQVRDFEFAGLAIPDHPVAALPYRLPANATERVDGLLGVTVLGAFDIDMDMPGRKMTLYGGTVCGDTAIPPWREAYITAPAEVSPRGRMHMQVRIGGHTLMALLDTGATASVITTRAALASGATAEQLAAAPVAVMRGVGPQPVPVRQLSFSEVQIGPERFAHARLLVTDSGLGPVDMIVGMDYLGGRRLWFSFARRQVFIMVPPRR
ncbi:MAG: aspartyl protease family protein [Acetobacteraceae bacterium]|nr:aspartyl protease family protein [Acetobacteraceae bacterium]